MKQEVVGRYELGVLAVEVVLREGYGAEYWTRPETGSCMRIKVGWEGPWNQVVTWLLHEAMECAMDNQKCRYRRTQDFSDATDGVSFHLDHAQFSIVCEEVGRFMSQVLPDFGRCWKKRNRLRK